MELSIIIPAFNAQETIGKAIDSIFSSFDEPEVIIIDDGSTDKTGKISDEYSKKYATVTVIHVPNGGVSNARNIGIEKASNDNIMFMDADDEYIFKSDSEIFNRLNENDMIIFSFDEKKMNGKLINKYLFNDEIVNSVEIVDCFLNHKYSFYGPWCKVFKKHIIDENGLRFDVGQKYGEDVVFVLKYLSKAVNGIYTSSSMCYTHYINPYGASYFSKLYMDMNLYLLKQVEAFNTLATAHNYLYSNVIKDFAAQIFNEAVIHYYLRTNKEIFFERYLRSYNIFKNHFDLRNLNNCSLFKCLSIYDLNEVNIVKNKTIKKIYKRNYFKKIKFAIKKMIFQKIK